MDLNTLRQELVTDDGVRLKAYTDTAGKLTIGVGRNLTDVGISMSEAMMLLDNSIQVACEGLDYIVPWWRAMPEFRQRVLVNMCFNLGPVKLAGFKLALAAMERGDYNEAANQMERSEWYNQVHGRGIRLVSLMRHGV